MESFTTNMPLTGRTLNPAISSIFDKYSSRIQLQTSSSSKESTTMKSPETDSEIKFNLQDGLMTNHEIITTSNTNKVQSQRTHPLENIGDSKPTQHPAISFYNKQPVMLVKNNIPTKHRRE